MLSSRLLNIGIFIFSLWESNLGISVVDHYVIIIPLQFQFNVE